MYKSTVIIIRCTLYTLVSKLLYRHITYSNVQGCQTTVKEGEKLGGHQKYDWLARDCLLLLGEFSEIYLPLIVRKTMTHLKTLTNYSQSSSDTAKSTMQRGNSSCSPKSCFLVC